MGRSAEFFAGLPQDKFVDARYGDKTQIPAPSERRAGPLPYPETYEEHMRTMDELEWKRSQ